MNYQYLVEYISQRAGDDDFSYECASRMMDIVEATAGSHFKNTREIESLVNKIREIKNSVPERNSSEAVIKKFVDMHGDNIIKLARMIEDFDDRPTSTSDAIKATGIALLVAGGMVALVLGISWLTVAYPVIGTILSILALIGIVVVSVGANIVENRAEEGIRHLLVIRTKLARINRSGIDPRVRAKIDDIIDSIDDAEQAWKRKEKADAIQRDKEKTAAMWAMAFS